MSTPQRTEKPVRLNLTQRVAAAEAKIVENPTFQGEKMKGWWLITPVESRCGNCASLRRSGDCA
jgi:hypothetical protein